MQCCISYTPLTSCDLSAVLQTPLFLVGSKEIERIDANKFAGYPSPHGDLFHKVILEWSSHFHASNSPCVFQSYMRKLVLFIILYINIDVYFFGFRYIKFLIGHQKDICSKEKQGIIKSLNKEKTTLEIVKNIKQRSQNDQRRN